MRNRFYPCLYAALALAGPGAGAARPAPAPRPSAAVIVGALPSPATAPLRAALTQAGYAVRTLSFEAAVRPDALKSISLLALPDARVLPAALHAPVEQFLHRGGHLVAFGLPGWKQPLIRSRGKTVTAERYATDNAWRPPAHPLLDLGRADLTVWHRASDRMESPTTARIEGTGTSASLHVSISNLTSWDTTGPPDLNKPFAPGETVTVFSAKGDERTTSLAVEWAEADGSRWIATVPLTTRWRRFELPPRAFRYWISNPRRGGPGDALRPTSATGFTVGLAFSHTGTVGGKHDYWIGNIGTSSAADAPLATMSSGEEIDGLYPGSKSFAVHDAAILKGLGATWKIPAGSLMRSPHPRQSGSGYNKGRTTRFIPLLEARSPSGAWRGVPGAMYVHHGGRYRDGVWALFGLTEGAVLRSPAFVNGLAGVCRKMRGALLLEGGTDWYTTFPGRAVDVGARLTGAPAMGTTVRIAIRDALSGRTVFERSWPATASDMAAQWTPPASSKGPWTATTTLLRGRQALDSIAQSIHVYSPPATPRFVTATDGRFILDGRPWKIHGVNYMPSSGVARDVQDNNEFEYWMGRDAYDPEIVARDLDNIRRLGLNAVSVFIYAGSVGSGNLLDLLRQCRERGLRADVSLRPGTPMDFPWDQIRPVITTYRLASDDAVIAYDLAWEPFFGGRAERAKYDPAWTDWVLRRYGSIDEATRRWGYNPRIAGNVLEGAADAELVRDGPWTAFVVDYRRFVDDLVGTKYAAARDLVRSEDPNHLVSFRMTETSNPTYNWDANLPYDFRGLADAVDFFAPEGYGRMGDWENTKHGWFEVQYARAINPALPVIWKEAGRSAWQAGLDDSPPNRLKEQGEVYAAFYRMLIASGSNGVYWWWYPGGFRTGEESDYGIINPDGTDRPSTRVIRENAGRFLSAPAPVKTDATVAIRLEGHATGLYGAYSDVKDLWWSLAGQGRSPRVIAESPGAPPGPMR